MPQVQAFAYSEASPSHSCSTRLAVRSAYFSLDPGTTWPHVTASLEAHCRAILRLHLHPASGRMLPKPQDARKVELFYSAVGPPRCGWPLAARKVEHT